MDELFNSPDMETYIDKYSKTRHISKEVAMTHKIVKEVSDYYEKLSKEKGYERNEDS